MALTQSTRFGWAGGVTLAGVALLLAAVLPGCNRDAPEPAPENLRMALDAGGIGVSPVRVNVQIYPDGSGEYKRYRIGELMEPPLEKGTFQLSRKQMEAIWTEIQSEDFFETKQIQSTGNVHHGISASISVVAHTDTHSVNATNVPVDAVSDILVVVNEATPEAANLRYSPGLTWSERWDRLIENFR